MLALSNPDPVSLADAEDFCRIDCDMAVGAVTHKVFFASDNPEMVLSPETRIAASLLPCMVAGAPLSSEKIDSQVLASLEEVQTIFRTWLPALSRVSLEDLGAAEKMPRFAKSRVAAFFSGGTDSFFTLMKHRDDITDIIFVHGLDIRLSDKKLRKQTADMVERVGKAFGKNVIQVETNIRTITDMYIPWKFAHGPVLAAIGHLFSGVMTKVYIPASHTYANLFPWGSHPLIDRLWSTHTTEFVHDGAEANRVRKTEMIAGSQIALESLRVCWMNYDNTYNCGRCEKCMRTMINLRIANALEQCTTFPRPLRMEDVLAIKINGSAMRSFLKESLDAVEAKGTDPELAKTLAELLEGQTPWQRFVNTMKRARNEPGRILPAMLRMAGLKS